ncbi:MAG: phosphoethanolamine transferase [Verrucomicrobia bacterium]|nr:phosphoethanolamine transferase [Verrucomicrobiota bacterium]
MSGFGYVASVGYLIFLLMCLADGRNFDHGFFHPHFSYLILSVGFALSLMLIYMYANRFGAHGARWASVVGFLLSVGLSILPFAYIVYSFQLGGGFSDDVVYSIMATDVRESLEFGRTFLSPMWVIVGAAFMAIVLVQKLKQETSGSRKIPNIVPAVQIMIILVIFCTQLQYFRLYRFPAACILTYYRELALFREMQERLESNKIQFEAGKEEGGETFVVVIGESLNKNHMGLYDYGRDTTPLLVEHGKAGDLLVFQRAYSSHTLTSETLSLSLTEANQQNGKNYFDSISILNVLKRVGVESSWITNQVLQGEWDNNISIIAHQADRLVPYNRWVGSVVRTRDSDEVVLGAYADMLSVKSEKNRVIFVHLMGNHWRYSGRYPESYEVFSDTNEPIDREAWLSLGEEIRQQVNDYDNSVLYNDFVVSSLLSLLKKSGGVSGFIYISDHGEDVYGGREHHAQLFTFDMIEIPMIVWFSDQYRERYPGKYSAMASHTDELFCNDALYDTLILTSP